jgi:hypothetical protein
VKTLTTPVSDQAAAAQSAWGEIYDIYLKATINTPVGSTNILRLGTVPGGLNFFTPTIAPEAVGTRGQAQNYAFWPLKRDVIKGDSSFMADRLGIAASNVTTEWAQMLEDVDWYDVPVLIRKVPLIGSPTAADYSVYFSGLVDSANVDLETVQLVCSNDMSTFNVRKPAEAMHANCRFRWGDDFCTAIRYLTENYKSKTVGSSSTKTVVFSAGLTEDSGTRASLGTDRVDALADAAFTPSSDSTGFEGYRVRQSTTGSWRWFSVTDLGTADNGTYIIPTGQAGLKNPALTPSLQIDFGLARRLKFWRITNAADVIERLARLILIFSSTNATDWTFETYHECPQILGGTTQINIPKASSARYWKICLRSRWAITQFRTDFEKIEAYEDGRNWWANGTITFAANTTTVALRNVSRAVLESYNGEITVMPLPVAPVSGDTFTIERGCPRTFNGCAERLNTENYGGFDSLPFEAVPR